MGGIGRRRLLAPLVVGGQLRRDYPPSLGVVRSVREVPIMRRIIPACAAVILLAGVSPTVAGEIQEREEHQERRIEKGERSGRLTPKEANRLENEQQTIEEERQRALEDGKITHGERREIRHDQKKANRDIRKKKHNERGRH
jgi:hypothetical protein